MSYIDSKELQDALGLTRRIQERNLKAEKASSEIVTPGANKLARLMHPKTQSMIIDSVKEENALMRTYRLKPDDGRTLAYFRAGQYVPVFAEIDGNIIERPYSISSSPQDSVGGFYDITVKKTEGGFVSAYVFDHWRMGAKVTLGGPAGWDYFSPVRDRRQVIGVAGGSGVTPFRSMARAIADGDLDMNLTLFYGCNVRSDVAFAEEWQEYEKASGGRFRYVLVLADEEKENAEKGFITLDIINKYCDIQNSSVFICGPEGLFAHMRKTLAPAGLRRKYVRYGLHGEAKGLGQDGTYTLTVKQAGRTYSVPASGKENLLVAMERAGVSPPVSCRNGACGFCRSYLISGEVVIDPDENGRRKMDKALGFIHPCCTFPAGDLEIVVPRK